MSQQGTGNEFGPLKSGSLSTIINQYKSSVTRWALKNDKTDFAWQSRFHDHIVRNSRSLDRIRAYIINNPKKWEGELFMGSADAKDTITGTEIAYYFICARKLWFFAHNIQCEQESDAVRMGRHIHKTSYKRKKKEVSIDGVIVIDWIDHDAKVIHEVKKSSSMEEAHQWQLKYYMWYLEQKGMDISDEDRATKFENDPDKRGYIGELNYPKLRQTKQIILSHKDRKTLEEKIIPNIRKIRNREKPPKKVEWDVCKYCSYNELCYS